MSQIRTVHMGGHRFYIHPEHHELVYPGVTSVIGMLPKQRFLAPWNARMAAELAVNSIDFVSEMAARDRDGAISYLAGAARRYTKTRADLGSELHDLFERMVRGERVGRVRSDLEPYRAHFAEFLEAVNPELVRAEDVVWSDKYEYAGSFDAWLRVWVDEEAGRITPDRSGTPQLIMVDWKTTRSTYADVALQLAAYIHADYVLSGETGECEEMPVFDGAAVLHITDSTWTFKPVRADSEVFEYFLHLRQVFQWERDMSRHVFGKPVAQKPGRVVTGTQRRAR